MPAGEKIEREYFVTKYALSTGKILRLKLTVDPKWPAYGYSENRMQFKIGRDAFENYPDARTAAGAEKVRRIKSLQRSIEKLEKLEFKKPD